MRALFLVVENVHDQEQFEAYRNLVMPTLEPFGGRFLVRGGKFTVIEGEWPHERMAILEFSSRAHAESWYNSPAYQSILPLRLTSMSSNAIIVDAVD